MIKTFHVRTHLQLVDVFTKALGAPVFLDLTNRLDLINIFSSNITYPQSWQDSEAISTAKAALVLRGVVKKINQKNKPEAVMNKGRLTRARRTKEQKKKRGLNDSSNNSISVLLRKLLVALKGVS